LLHTVCLLNIYVTNMSSSANKKGVLKNHTTYIFMYSLAILYGKIKLQCSVTSEVASEVAISVILLQLALLLLYCDCS